MKFKKHPSRRLIEPYSKNISFSGTHKFFDAYTIHAELPGVRKADVNVTFENGVLTLSAETKSETEEKEGERVIRQERRYGKYMRSLRLGADIDESKVMANYKDGVLEIVLPKAEAVKPKRINVDVG